MKSSGKPSQRKKGVGSIIGAVFLVLIILSGFTFYQLYLNIADHYNGTLQSMGESDWSRNREEIVIKNVDMTSAGNLNVTVENDGAFQSHLIWFGIFNKSATPETQAYYPLDISIDPAETKNAVSSFAVTQGKKYAVQLVTELGNAIGFKFYPASEVKCWLTLTTAPPTAYKGNNVTVVLTVTHNDSEVDAIQSLTVSLSATPSGLVQLMDNSSLSARGLGKGESAFFWWVYNTTGTGTVAFNATYGQAPAGVYALASLNVLDSPGGGGTVSITGVNCTAPYNPLQWSLLGSTAYVSGSISDLAIDDTRYANFSSYYSSASRDINDFVDSVAPNFSSPDKGTRSSFDNQKAKDGNYDTLTEANTATYPKYYPSNANLLGSTQLVSGNITDLQSDNGAYMTFRSWPSQNSSATFGNTNTGTESYSIENNIVGSLFTAADNGWAENITAYLQITSYTKNVKCAIYNHSNLSLVAYTQERSISTSPSPNWQTFTFNAPKPSLTAGTQYILVAWASFGSGGDAQFYRQDGTTDQAHYDLNYAYGTWPNPLTVDSHGARSYCIYCAYTKPTEYTSAVEFTGTSNTQTWSRLVWMLDGSYTTSGVATTFQLYNDQSGTYPTSGDGYNLTTIGTTDVTVSQTITTNPTYFRDASGNWKLKLTGTKATNSSFDCRVDLVQYQAGSDNYELDLKEQWTAADYGEANEYLCIYTGALSAENLSVAVWTGSAWTTLMTLGSADSNAWRNASVSSYLASSNFTIRFKGGNETNDAVQDSWNIDATLLHTWYHEYTAEVELTGSSNQQSWTQLVWLVDSSWDTGQVNVTIQAYNYTLGSYPSSGNGYISYNSSATPYTDELGSQTITSGATQFRNSTSPCYWKVKIKGVKSTSTQFQMKVNWIELQDSYAYTGDTVPYKAWQWYTIQATGASGNPVPFTYASLYANGTTVTFQNATDGTPVSNPAWLRLDANGAFQLQIKSTTSSGETFVLSVAVGTVIQQKTIIQAAQQ